MELLKTYIDFFKALNWRFVFAASAMIIIAVAVFYLIYTIYFSVRERAESLKVVLPDIKTIDENFKIAKPQFKNNENLTVESVEQGDNKTGELNQDNGTIFEQSLAMETKTYIPQKQEDAEMPTIEEFDVEELKQRRFEEAVKIREEQARRLREIAESDEEEEDVEFEEILRVNKLEDRGEFND